MRLLLFPIFVVAFTNIMYAQADTIGPTCRIEGIVYDEQGNPMPGVTVMESNHTDSTTTDSEGTFALPCHKTSLTLIVSFIGYKSQEIVADTSRRLQVTLASDAEPIDGEPFYCISYNRFIKVGFSSGLRYTPVGLRVESYTPYLFGTWPQLYTTFEWRTSHAGNQYYNVSVRRHELARIHNKWLRLLGEFKKIKTAATDFREFSIAPEFPFGKTEVSLGYTYQRAVRSETEEAGHGVYLACYMYLPQNLSIDLRAKYVLHNFQYDLKAYWNFWQSGIRTGIGFERMGSLNEITATLQYHLNY